MCKQLSNKIRCNNDLDEKPVILDDELLKKFEQDCKDRNLLKMLKCLSEQDHDDLASVNMHIDISTECFVEQLIISCLEVLDKYLQ